MSGEHRTDQQGRCLEACPNPVHKTSPVLLMVSPALEQPIRSFLDQLGVEPIYQPTAPDEVGGMRSYVAVADERLTADLTRTFDAAFGGRNRRP